MFKQFFGKLSPFLVALAFAPWVFWLYFVVSSYVIYLNPDDKDIIESFIDWFGTAYSLFLALVLGYVWKQFESLDREFDLEVDALASLHQTSSYITEILSARTSRTGQRKRDKTLNCIKEIEYLIKEYVKHVIQDYQVEYSDTTTRQKGDNFLNSMGRLISLMSYDDLVPDTLVSELFQKLNEAMDVRGDRIAHSKQRMPSAVWLVALVSSIVWLVPFLGLIISDFYVSLFLVGGATFVILMVLTIVKDLDDPFHGAWKVNIDSWDEFLRSLP